MTVLESYLELGELLTIRYDPNDLSGQLERPYETSRACIWACPLFEVRNAAFKNKHNYIDLFLTADLHTFGHRTSSLNTQITRSKKWRRDLDEYN